jgi:hypothetical protein
MKYLATHFDDYVSSVEKCNLHPKLINYYKKFPSLYSLTNLLFYGPSGAGKYSQVLYSIKKYSPSNLKYEKKISLVVNKTNIVFKISDIHYEVDLSLLGCNSKLIWHDLYKQITDIIATKQEKIGIILCKNFHSISNELLETFYSYMQDNNIHQIKLIYILITEEISFIPSNIINCCQVINVPKPSNKHFVELLGHKLTTPINDITNIKCEISQITELKHSHKITCDQIIKNMNNIDTLDFLKFRDLLYDIFIYDLNITKCVWYILTELTKTNQINLTNMKDILINTNIFFKYYNNNYRPIYHLERFLFYLISVLHEYK